MKRALISLALLPILAQAKVTLGIGEYRYGPDTPQNLACVLAEDRAKDNAISRFVGEQIESATFQRCENESCELQKDTITNVKGYVKKVIDKQERKVEAQGYTSCIVTLRADVDRLQNEIKLSLSEDNYHYKENEEVIFRGVVNRTGNFVIYDLYKDVYHKVYIEKIATPNKEFVLPSTKNRIIAKLPDGELTSKEVLMILFTENDFDFKDSYTTLEMKQFLSTIPTHQRQIASRYVYIMKYIDKGNI